jgi:hypothetical protein
MRKIWKWNSRKGSRAIFSKKLKQKTITYPLFVFSDTQKTFVTLQFAHPITQKLPILLKEDENIGNCSVIITCSRT